MERYTVLKKNIGETPLDCLERFRATRPDLASTPLTYAGRLDPMASGLLLVLIGEECKRQTQYHHLDKQYEVSVLVGVYSDSGDVLGIVHESTPPTKNHWPTLLKNLVGSITLPYPHFSARTVGGTPLHTLAVTGKINEVTIPEKTSTIYQLSLRGIRTLTRAELATYAQNKIALLPPVTDPRKSLGNDFRRPDVLASWHQFAEQGNKSDTFTILDITCTCSSGTYMRSLADEIGKQNGSRGLALSIHRTTIGNYQPLIGSFGWWKKRYR